MGMVRSNAKIFDGQVKEVHVLDSGTYTTLGVLPDSAVKISSKPDTLKLTNKEEYQKGHTFDIEIKCLQFFDLLEIEKFTNKTVMLALVGDTIYNNNGTVASQYLAHIKDITLRLEMNLESDKEAGVTLKATKYSKTIRGVFDPAPTTGIPTIQALPDIWQNNYVPPSNWSERVITLNNAIADVDRHFWDNSQYILLPCDNQTHINKLVVFMPDASQVVGMYVLSGGVWIDLTGFWTWESGIKKVTYINKINSSLTMSNTIKLMYY